MTQHRHPHSVVVVVVARKVVAILGDLNQWREVSAVAPPPAAVASVVAAFPVLVPSPVDPAVVVAAAAVCHTLVPTAVVADCRTYR